MIRQLLAAVTGSAILTILGACDSTGSSRPSPSASPTLTSLPRSAPSESAETRAVAAASTAYRQFIAATDAAYSSGGVNVAGLKKHASGVMLAAELNQAATFRGKGWHSVGRQEVVWIEPLAIGKPDARGQINYLILRACIDASKATAVDTSGKSVKLPGTPLQAIDEMRMRRTQGAWKADYPQNRKGGNCSLPR